MDKDTVKWVIDRIARNARLAGEYTAKVSSADETVHEAIIATWRAVAAKYDKEVKTDMAWVKAQLSA